MKIVFATNNLNKLSEIRALVPCSIEILSLSDINCYEELPETKPTLEENSFVNFKPIKIATTIKFTIIHIRKM